MRPRAPRHRLPPMHPPLTTCLCLLHHRHPHGVATRACTHPPTSPPIQTPSHLTPHTQPLTRCCHPRMHTPTHLTPHPHTPHTQPLTRCARGWRRWVSSSWTPPRAPPGALAPASTSPTPSPRQGLQRRRQQSLLLCRHSSSSTSSTRGTSSLPGLGARPLLCSLPLFLGNQHLQSTPRRDAHSPSPAPAFCCSPRAPCCCCCCYCCCSSCCRWRSK